jgi:hypothetical protein
VTVLAVHSSGLKLIASGPSPFELSVALSCTLARVPVSLRDKLELKNRVKFLLYFCPNELYAEVPCEHWHVERFPMISV